MYKYDQYDQAMVDARVEEFRDQTRRRIEGKLDDDQFKPLRLKNGLYLQLHAYMLRVAIPYGTFDSRQMRRLAHIARKPVSQGRGRAPATDGLQRNADLFGRRGDVGLVREGARHNCINIRGIYLAPEALLIL